MKFIQKLFNKNTKKIEMKFFSFVCLFMHLCYGFLLRKTEYEHFFVCVFSIVILMIETQNLCYRIRNKAKKNSCSEKLMINVLNSLASK